VLATPLRQMLFGFYSSCDVVATPSHAAADHLAEMGVPRVGPGNMPFRCIAQVKCPYRVAGKTSALGAGSDISKSAYVICHVVDPRFVDVNGNT